MPGFLGAVMVGASLPAITGMKIWGWASTGYSNNTGVNISPVLKASNTNPTTNSWSGATIGSITTFGNAWATTAKQTLGNSNLTRYRYVWLEMGLSPADPTFLCEVQFFETLNGVETAIDPSGKSIISAGYDTDQSLGFDGVTNASAGPTGPSGTIFRIGLDLGA
jgi:hypothetical protein